MNNTIITETRDSSVSAETAIMSDVSAMYQLDTFADNFAPGHYARVISGTDLRSNESIVFKVLRPEHLQKNGKPKWEYQAFGNEVQILSQLAGNPHVVDFLDCGYVSSAEEAPHDGEIESFGRNVDAFSAASDEYARRGWRPYLTMPNLPRTHSLYYVMKPSKSAKRRRLPSEEGLALAIQFANALQVAHRRNIVYLDHKLEHVYWDGKRLLIIDFNSSKQLNGNARDAQDCVKDIQGLCAGVLYPLFTGMSPQSTPLRAQPSSMEQVEERYSQIMELDFSMEPGLSKDLQDVLQAGASREIENIDEFTSYLRHVGTLHGWDFPNLYAEPASRQVRDQMTHGLSLLREGHDKIREARDIFREAMIQENISEDLENELRRLATQINDMLNKRVIP